MSSFQKQGDIYVPTTSEVRGLDRRGFMIESIRYGGAASAAAALGPALAGCDMLGGAPADGSLEAPWTSVDYGALDPAVETPLVFAGLSTEGGTRIWVEVINTNTGDPHPQQVDHFIKTLLIEDQYNNPIAQRSFAYQNEARLIETIVLPADVETLNVYRECSQHDWWKETLTVESLAVEPKGDLRRPLTAAKPGPWPDKIAVHLPVFGKRPGGQYSVEVGDRAGGKLHPMDETHYISTILVFDENDQLRVRAGLDPAYNPEPVVDFAPIGGSSRLRVIEFCNLHNWWEVVYIVA